jgi:hypothetical protein
VQPAQFSPSPNSSLKNKSNHDVTKMDHEDVVQGWNYVNRVLKLQVLLKHTLEKVKIQTVKTSFNPMSDD